MHIREIGQKQEEKMVEYEGEKNDGETRWMKDIIVYFLLFLFLCSHPGRKNRGNNRFRVGWDVGVVGRLGPAERPIRDLEED